MALLNPYCTVAQVQEELRNSDESLVPVIEQAINQASRYIDALLGYDCFQHDHTTNPLRLYWRSRFVAGDQLWIPYPHVQRIDKVVADGVQLTDGTDYVVAGRRLMRIDGLDWLDEGTDEAVEIYGKFGWPQESASDVPVGLPEHFTRACIWIAACFTGHNQKEIVGTDGSIITITDRTIPRSVYDLLLPHRAILQ